MEAVSFHLTLRELLVDTDVPDGVAQQHMQTALYFSDPDFPREIDMNAQDLPLRSFLKWPQHLNDHNNAQQSEEPDWQHVLPRDMGEVNSRLRQVLAAMGEK